MESTKSFNCPHALNDALHRDLLNAPQEMLSLLSDLRDSVNFAIDIKINQEDTIRLSEHVRHMLNEWCKNNGVIY